MEYLDLPHFHGEQENVKEIKEQLTDIEHFQIVSDVFRHLSDPTRIRIFWMLCHCEECVINISALMEMSSPAISHHLRPLKDSGLITSRREGKEVYYKAADTEQSRLLHLMIEKVMAIPCPIHNKRAEHSTEEHPTQYPPEQVEIARKVHDYLMENINTRCTIESLAKRYLMNPTTLKTVFKGIYGNSIAAHMKEHRMEQAAKLLLETQDSIAQIAQSVGYDSQSKFTAAFKNYFHTLPTEYRKSH